MSITANIEEFHDHAACGLIIFRLDGAILHANHTLLEWLGVELQEITHKKFSDLLYKGGKLYYNLFVYPMLQLHQKVDEINFEIQTATGSFPTLFSAVIQELKDGENVINGTVFKIADRKKYEAELMKEKDLFKNENLVKTRALTEIAFNQAHLIRAPLANIMGLIHLLEENKGLDDPTKQLLDLLNKSALNLDTVIRDIVDLSDDGTR